MPAQPPAGAPMEIFAECADWLLVIGGSAVVSYGMDRMTFDSDCAILERDEPRLQLALSHVGYVLNDRRPSFTRYLHLGKTRPVVDVMRVDADTFSKLLKESRLVRILEHLVRVPAPLHLVAMKLHALKQQPDRDYKDLPDIRFLLEHFPGDWTRSQLRGLVERYGSEHVIDVLRKDGFL